MKITGLHRPDNQRDFTTVTQVLTVVLVMFTGMATAPAQYHSPIAVSATPDGRHFAVTDFTGGQVVLVTADGKNSKPIALNGQPAGVAWSADGKSLFVAERGAGTVAEISVHDTKVTRRFNVGRYPVGVAISATHLVATDNGQNALVIFDLATGKATARVPCVYRPWDVRITPDGKVAVVSNLTPWGDARELTHASCVTLVDVAAGVKIEDIKLPSGSTSLRGVAISPDGKRAYIAHSIGRFTLPTTQLERGWVMTHGMSILNLETRKHFATVLLDFMMEGAADPWDISLSPDGAIGWITLAGVHQVARVNLKDLHSFLEGKAVPERLKNLPHTSLWHQIAKDPQRVSDLVSDLAALYSANLISRHTIPNAQGTRGIAWSPAGNGTLAVTSYFSGELILCDPDTLAVRSRLALGTNPPETDARAGERLFFDAKQCFQYWLSCASCHPETRADGLNWDLLNDGIGNPKNTKSMLLAHRTPPMMWSGVRKDLAMATQKGFMVIQFRDVSEETLAKTRAYISSLRPESSPFRIPQPDKTLTCVTCHHQDMRQSRPDDHPPIDGLLSPQAERGLKLFTSPEVGCATCHTGPLFTDLKKYDVGTSRPIDQQTEFDTPTLFELWRTAPFLHDGSAVSLMDVLTTHNQENKHGKTSHLSKEDLEALVAYLLSL